jgi:hypothetical protein
VQSVWAILDALISTELRDGAFPIMLELNCVDAVPFVIKKSPGKMCLINGMRAVSKPIRKIVYA